eukprot:s2250_g3.t1
MVAEIVKHPRTHEQWPERQTKAVGQASSAWMFYSSLPSVYSEMLESLFLESSGHSILALLDSGCADIDGVIHRQGAMGPGLSMFGKAGLTDKGRNQKPPTSFHSAELCASFHGAGRLLAMTELGEALESRPEALEQKHDHEEMSLPEVPPQDRERLRSEQAWASYQAFLTMPGDKCTQCWLMRKHCCCKGLPRIEIRLRVYVLMHRLEIGQRKASNTAKLLKHFGAELLCWGVEEHDARLQQLLVDDEEGTVVLFPSPDAVEAGSLAAAPRQVIVLDGGWRECVRMNSWISRNMTAAVHCPRRAFRAMAKVAKSQVPPTSSVELAQVQKAIADLERKLQEVQNIHSIVEFDANALSAPRAVPSERRDPRLTLAPGGAAALAAEVAEELKAWRKRREDAYSQRRRVHEKRHRDAVLAKQQEEEDKQMVRAFLRDAILDTAKTELAGTLADSEESPARKGGPGRPRAPELGDHAHVSSGATALASLRNHLEVVVEHLEAMDVPLPTEMVHAAQFASSALQRKRERIKPALLKQRFAEATNTVDQPLLEAAEQGFEKRREALEAQALRLRDVVDVLRKSVDQRQGAFHELDAVNRGPAAATQVPKAFWKALHPGPDPRSEELKEASDDSEGSTTPRHASLEDSMKEDKLRQHLRRQVLDWGQGRIDAIKARFQQCYSQAKSGSQESWMAESRLEAWNLTTKLDLLKDLESEAQLWHQRKLAALKKLLQEYGGSRGQTENGATAVAEVFFTLKTGINKSLQGIAAAEVADHSLNRLEHLSSWHEHRLQLVQRRSDVEQGFAERLLESAGARCLAQLGEAAQGLVQRCLEALPLPAPAVEPQGPSDTLQRWEQAEMPVADRFKDISAALSGLPATAETCALEHAVLAVIDAELQRICGQVESRPDASEAAQTLQEELEKLESQAQEREEVLKASRASPIGQSLGGMLRSLLDKVRPRIRRCIVRA